MPQPQLEKIVYPAVRDLMLAQPTAGDSISHNGWSVDSDSRAWMAQGRGFTLHPSDRSYQPTRKSANRVRASLVGVWLRSAIKIATKAAIIPTVCKTS